MLLREALYGAAIKLERCTVLNIMMKIISKEDEMIGNVETVGIRTY